MTHDTRNPRIYSRLQIAAQLYRKVADRQLVETAGLTAPQLGGAAISAALVDGGADASGFAAAVALAVDVADAIISQTIAADIEKMQLLLDDAWAQTLD